jgi:CRP-like cAMP-binding protein
MTSVEEPAGQFFSQDKIARVNNSTAAVAMESESVETEEVCLEVSHRGEKEGDGTVPKAVFELEMSGEGGPSADATARELFRADSLVHVDRQIVDVDIYNMNRAESLALRHKGYTKRQALLWMILQLVCLLYNVFVTPVQICYLNYNILNGRNTGLHVMDYVVDSLCAIDIYLRRKRGRDDNKMLSYEHNGTFWVDMFATVPFELFAALFGARGDFLFAVLRSNRLFRMIRLQRYHFTDFLGDDQTFDIAYERMVFLFMCMYTFAHYFGCLFYFCALYVARAYPDEPTWPEKDGLWVVLQDPGGFPPANGTSSPAQNSSAPCLATMATTFTQENGKGLATLCFLTSGFNRYCRSQYWAIITMVTIGLGDIVPQSPIATWVTTLSLYAGMLLTAAAVANLTLLVLKQDSRALAFQKKLDGANKYLEFRDIPLETRNKIRAFLTYTWASTENAISAKHLLALPDDVKTELMYHDPINLLKKKNLPSAFIRALVPHLQKRFYTPYDQICTEDNVCDYGFLLHKGVANLYIHDLPIRRLVKGDFFGHSIFLSDSHASDATRRAEDSGREVEEGQAYETMASESLGGKGANSDELPRWGYSVRAKTYCAVFYIDEHTYFEEVWNTLDTKEREAVDKIVGQGLGEFQGHNICASKAQPAWKIGNKKEHSLFKPESKFRDVWFLCTFLGIAYNAFSVPLGIAFIFDERWKGVSPFTVIVDVFFVIDLFFNLYVFQIWDQDTGLVVKDSAKISEHYRSEGSFVVDLISAIPLDFFALAMGDYNGINYVAIFRLTKIVRLSHLYEYFSWVENFFVHVRGYLSTTIRRFVRLYYLLILACHWCACGFYFIAELSKFEGWAETTWISADASNENRLIDPDSGSGLVGYLRSLYFVLVCASTVGYGDIAPTNLVETIYVAITMLFGGLLKPAVVGGLASLIVGYVKDKNADKQQAVDLGKTKSIQNDDIGHTLDEAAFLRELSPSLASSILDHNVGKLVRNIEFFHGRSDIFFKNVVDAFRPAYFIPEETILKFADVGDSMYVLKRGKVKVTNESNDVVYCTLNSGCYFGEIAMLQDTTRNANVIAVDYCDCFALTRQEFIRAEQNSHDFQGRETVLALLRASWDKKNKSNSLLEETLDKKLEHLTTDSVPANKSGEAETNPETSKTVTNSTGPKGRSDNMVLRAVRMVFLRRETVFNAAILYNLFSIPVHFAYAFPLYYFAIDWVLDGALWCIFYYLKKQGGEVARADFWALFPFDLLVCLPIMYGLASEYESVKYYYSMCLSLCRLNKVLLCRRYRFGKQVTGLNLLTLILLVGHICACIFYFIARYQHGERHFICMGYNTTGGTTCEWKGTWMELQMVDGLLPWSGGDTFTHYVRSLNWAIPTLVVVVIGDATPVTVFETIFVALVILFGLCINAVVIGSIVSLVAARNRKKSDRLLRKNTSVSVIGRTWWSHCLTFVSLYNLIVIPLRIAITFEVWTFFFDWVCDIFLLTDLYIYVREKKNHGLEEKWGGVELYKVLASIPLDIIAAFFVGSTGNWSLWISLLRLNKCFRLNDVRVRRILVRAKMVPKLLGALFVINHMLTCIWIFIHRYVEWNLPDTWAIRDGLSSYSPSLGMHNGYDDGWAIYYRGFYFTIVVLSTCGYGDIRPVNNVETVYNITIALLGSILLGTFCGEFVSYFEHLDTQDKVVNKKIRHSLTSFMLLKNLNSRKQNEILEKAKL